jgi:hypothetical protein
VQATHAAIQATNLFPSHDPYLVVLEVRDQGELLAARDRLHDLGVDCAPFFESDLPEPGFTALATGPLGADARRHLRGYRLWRS